MAVDHLENLILTEANRLGIQPNAAALQQSAIDLAGSVMTNDGLIAIPGRGSIAPKDYIRSLRDSMPEAFGNLDYKPVAKQADTLTDRYKAEIAASRKQARITDADIARYSGVTREHMQERQRAAQGK